MFRLGVLVEIDGAPDGALWTHGDPVNRALLAFSTG